jgi:hypothetical protein
MTQRPAPRAWGLPRAARRPVAVVQLPTAALRRVAERRSARAEPVAQAALRRWVAVLPPELAALAVAPLGSAAQGQEPAPAVQQRPALAWSQARLLAAGPQPRFSAASPGP